MKEFQNYSIVAVVAFGLGFSSWTGLGVFQRKTANSRFLLESHHTLEGIRGSLKRFRQEKGRFPRNVSELYDGAYLDPAQPPIESMRRGGQWVSAWDGEGGFLYLSGTGQVYLNADVSREKFFGNDWKEVLEGGMFPPGKIY
jgi:hypothetical protein